MNDPRLENLTTLTKFPVCVRPHIQKSKLSGYYITAKAFPLGCPELPKEQWVGLHRGYMVCTLDHPAEARSLMYVQTDLPEIEDAGVVSWVGKISCSRTKYGACLYVPLDIWKPQQEVSTQKTVGYGEGVKGKINGVYVLLHLPAIKPNQ